MSVNAKQLEEFLEKRGATILPTTNSWEVSRFKTVNGVCVIYTNAKHRITFSNKHAEDAYAAFKNGKEWTATAVTKRRKRKTIEEQLLNRDGYGCFYCSHHFTEKHPATLEHLLAVTLGGTNHMANLALAHELCNQEAGNMPVVDKVRLRDEMRNEKAKYLKRLQETA